MEVSARNGTIQILDIQELLKVFAVGDSFRAIGANFVYVATVEPECGERRNSTYADINADEDEALCVKTTQNGETTMESDISMSMSEVMLLDKKAKAFIERVHPNFYEEMTFIELKR